MKFIVVIDQQLSFEKVTVEANNWEECDDAIAFYDNNGDISCWMNKKFVVSIEKVWQ